MTWNRGDIRLATADERAEVGARLKLAGLVKDSDGAYVPGRKSAREVLRGKPADELLRDGTR